MDNQKRKQNPLMEQLGDRASLVLDLNRNTDAAKLKSYFESLRLICRIFFSLNYQELPQYFEDTMSEWMSIFAKYLQ